MYEYRAFGLTIHSELELPELLRGEGIPDLTIRLGDVPETLSNPTARGVRFQATASEFLLKVDGHARYLVAGGREIVIDREGGPVDAVRLFLLGSVIGALLHQRGLLVLHASAVELRDGAAIFMGPSGAGKSTLAAALAKRGYRVLSDEVTAITQRDGQPYVLPGFPQLNVWADVAKKLGHELSALRRVRPELEKYAVSLGQTYSDAPLPISEAYVLATTNTSDLKIDRLKGVDKLTSIVGHTYRARSMDEDDSRARHFERCAAVAAKARVYKLVRPDLPFLLTEITDLLERGPSS